MKKLFLIFSLFFLTLTSMTFLDRDGSDALSIYPLPISKITHIKSDLQISKLEVYNLLGTKVLERENEGDLDFTDMPTGYYIIKAYTSRGVLLKRVQKN
jgi:Secretion system C-terminal sorting domain